MAALPPHPEIVYLQTRTDCDGHCRYCPFDDVYERGALDRSAMDAHLYDVVLEALAEWGFAGRLGFLLHFEPTLDDRLPEWFRRAREKLPGVTIEIATNGKRDDSPVIASADIVTKVPPGGKSGPNSRAGNVGACLEIESRQTFPQPCVVPVETMCVAADGSVLLCCQDWRHESVVGRAEDLIAARRAQLAAWRHVRRLAFEICRDCAAGRTAEEVGSRLGRRRLVPLKYSAPHRVRAAAREAVARPRRAARSMLRGILGL